MVGYFVVITGTVNDVNNSSVIYRTSSKVSFVSPVKLWKLDMSPLCSKQTTFSLVLSSVPNCNMTGNKMTPMHVFGKQFNEHLILKAQALRTVYTCTRMHRNYVFVAQTYNITAWSPQWQKFDVSGILMNGTVGTLSTKNRVSKAQVCHVWSGFGLSKRWGMPRFVRHVLCSVASC